MPCKKKKHSKWYYINKKKNKSKNPIIKMGNQAKKSLLGK